MNCDSVSKYELFTGLRLLLRVYVRSKYKALGLAGVLNT